MNFSDYIANELSLHPQHTGSVLKMHEEGATVPFMARYRKEQTGAMDETVIRQVLERFEYLKEITERKDTIIKSIESQGKLSQDLRIQIESCLDKQKLEDIYLPYKPKRRTKATIAKEKGLEPLLELILNSTSSNTDIIELAKPFINTEKEVLTAEDAIKGASDIYAENISEKVEVREFLRNYFVNEGLFVSLVKKEFEGQKTKYDMYYDYKIPVRTVASHNMLALRRAEKEKVITLSIEVNDETVQQEIFRKFAKFNKGGSVSDFERLAVNDSYLRLLYPSICTEIRLIKKKDADTDAIITFATSIRELLLAAPAGSVPVLAVDPGFRSGCKVVCLDETGKFKEYVTIYPHEPQCQKEDAKNTISRLVFVHKPKYIAIGNGTASRDTERFIDEFLKTIPESDRPKSLMVSESGASVYSASEIAIKEFPTHDVTVRGAISIGRRLMDPLAELVKIDPKSIGVGQYQHDVDQKQLQGKLDDVVESCVNHVGVELNSASAKLLSYVSGISSTVAENIVSYRDAHGQFNSRKDLLNVAKFGQKTFEQAAGFLRIRSATNPLDYSAVHPESYYIVEKIAQSKQLKPEQLIGNIQVLSSLKVKDFIDEKTGEFTINDIIDELKKPGRDPRQEFVYAKFRDDIQEITDLKIGMTLEGVVSNVTNFGAFVDIGVHQDGLVHISHLSDDYVKDPASVVKVGQRVSVRVLTIDVPLKRISLTMKSDAFADGLPKSTNNLGTPNNSGGKKNYIGKPESKRNDNVANATLDDLMNKFNSGKRR